MTEFTIETTYMLPVFRQRVYAADSVEEACKAAADDDEWDGAEKDYDNSRPVFVSGAWLGDEAYVGPDITPAGLGEADR